MNAEEAREQSRLINVDRNNSQYAEIKNAIEKAVNEGLYETFIYEHIKSDVDKLLSEEGYGVGSNQGKYNETCIRISW